MLLQQIFVPGGIGHIHHQAVPCGIYANRPFRFDTRHILAIARHFAERNVGKYEGIQIQQRGFLMRQNLARLNDNLIKMAQILDWRAAAIIKNDVTLFQPVSPVGKHARGHEQEWQQQPNHAETERQHFAVKYRFIIAEHWTEIEDTIAIFSSSLLSGNAAMPYTG